MGAPACMTWWPSWPLQSVYIGLCPVCLSSSPVLTYAPSSLISIRLGIPNFMPQMDLEQFQWFQSLVHATPHGEDVIGLRSLYLSSASILILTREQLFMLTTLIPILTLANNGLQPLSSHSRTTSAISQCWSLYILTIPSDHLQPQSLHSPIMVSNHSLVVSHFHSLHWYSYFHSSVVSHFCSPNVTLQL